MQIVGTFIILSGLAETWVSASDRRAAQWIRQRCERFHSRLHRVFRRTRDVTVQPTAAGVLVFSATASVSPGQPEENASAAEWGAYLSARLDLQGQELRAQIQADRQSILDLLDSTSVRHDERFAELEDRNERSLRAVRVDGLGVAAMGALLTLMGLLLTF